MFAVRSRHPVMEILISPYQGPNLRPNLRCKLLQAVASCDNARRGGVFVRNGLTRTTNWQRITVLLFTLH
eukprot:5997115-Prymnesium_polylepis.1